MLTVLVMHASHWLAAQRTQAGATSAQCLLRQPTEYVLFYPVVLPTRYLQSTARQTNIINVLKAYYEDTDSMQTDISKCNKTDWNNTTNAGHCLGTRNSSLSWRPQQQAECLYGIPSFPVYSIKNTKTNYMESTMRRYNSPQKRNFEQVLSPTLATPTIRRIKYK